MKNCIEVWTGFEHGLPELINQIDLQFQEIVQRLNRTTKVLIKLSSSFVVSLLSMNTGCS